MGAYIIGVTIISLTCSKIRAPDAMHPSCSFDDLNSFNDIVKKCMEMEDTSLMTQ